MWTAAVSAAVACSPEDLTARCAEGPALVLTREGLARARQRIASDADARAWWTGFRARVEREFLKKPVTIPPRGAQWWHYYSCKACGGRLEGQTPTNHVCKTCGAAYTGWPYDDAYWFLHQHRAGEAVRDCALAALLADADGARFAEQAKTTLLALARAYPAYLPHDRSGPGPVDLAKRKRPRCGRAFPQALDEAVWLINVLQGFDCLRDALTDAEKDLVREQLVRPAATLIKRDGFGIHNHECWHLAAYGLAGLALGDAAFVADAIDSATGVRQQLEKGILADDCWFEGAWGYHFYTIRALAPFFTALNNLGFPPCERFAAMFRAPFGQITPTWQLPAVNDTGRMRFAPGDEADLYELAWTWWREPSAAWWVTRKRRATKAYALWGAPADAAAAVPPAFVSRNYAASGFAVLRGQTPGAAAGVMPDTYAAVDYGPHGGGHGHPDKLNLILWGRGQMLAEDPGCISYGNPRFWHWYRSSLAHNTLVMDGRNQAYTEGKCLSFTPTNAVFDAGGAYPGAVVRRAVQVTDGVALDILWARAAAPHTWEWAFHARGTATVSAPTEPVTLPPPDLETKHTFGRDADGTQAWSWTTGAREGAFATDWSADWTDGKGRCLLGLRQTVRGDGGAGVSGRLRTARASAQPPPATCDLAVPRVEGLTNVVFATVLAPGIPAAEIAVVSFVNPAPDTFTLTATVAGRAHTFRVGPLAAR